VQSLEVHFSWSKREYENIGQVLSWGLGSGFGWALAIVSLAAVREKMKYNHIPAPLKALALLYRYRLNEHCFMSFMELHFNGQNLNTMILVSTTLVIVTSIMHF
jgi:Na+-transporting NADH:ubiquinone oxidoreductase subunit NqrE